MSCITLPFQRFRLCFNNDENSYCYILQIIQDAVDADMKKFEMDIAALEADMETRYKQRRHPYSSLFITSKTSRKQLFKATEGPGEFLYRGYYEDYLFTICSCFFFPGYTCSTTGKPTRSFATERVSLDSV